MAELAGITSEKSYNTGVYVLWEGEAPTNFYVVADGRVKISKVSPSGKEFIVAFFGPGEIFGEVAVFENKLYPASAQAVTTSKVLNIRREDFLKFLSQSPDVAIKIINILGSRLREAVGRLRDLAGERVEQRIAGILLMLSHKLGPELSFTRQEIADMAGTTIETAIRVMSRFKEGGIIKTTRGKITIADENRLRLLSEGPPQL